LMIGTVQVQVAKAQLGELAWNEAVPVPGSHSRVLLVGTRRKSEQTALPN